MTFKTNKFERGYTLLELIIILVIVGILSAIVAPSWFAFLTRLRLNAAQSEALSIMRDAQANAKRQKNIWEACFRQNEAEKKVQWSVHPAPQSGREICANANWQNLLRSDASNIAIDANRSTFYNTSNIYRIQFKHNGWANGQLGRITFTAPNPRNNSSKRCVFASTLLGAMRTDRDRGCE